MGKSLYIAEKPSVGEAFARALGVLGPNENRGRKNYLEKDDVIISWCFGHLVTMSYPEVYDPALKKWTLNTLPFLPTEYKYEVIDSARDQFQLLAGLMSRPDVDTIYVCTDSGREGEYIYRLVEQEAHVTGKQRKRVWIDSQTDDEIKKGIREAKDLSAYDALAASAYLRAKEDYLMGINFSRALTLRYGNDIAQVFQEKSAVVSVGRVMSCVLGMVVNREREIRDFQKTPFYRVLTKVDASDEEGKTATFQAEWKAVEGSAYYQSPALYKENGFKKEEDAKALIELVRSKASDPTLIPGQIESAERKMEKKAAPLLYNLAEIQNDCSKLFKISPEQTLKVIQELYEKKLVTYPRTDARFLSTAVAKEIHKNLKGLLYYPLCSGFAKQILDSGAYKGIASTKYVNDKKITDHYAIIPTGDGLNGLSRLSPLHQKVYEIIARRFLSIFYGPTVYQKMNLVIRTESNERFFAGFKVMVEEGYRVVSQFSFSKKNGEEKTADNKPVEKSEHNSDPEEKKDEENEENQEVDASFLNALKALKKGSIVNLHDLSIKEGETSPPKRYTSGSLILAMENAGQLIEDEELRAQIKGSGIGTSATRSGILEKLSKIQYLVTNPKTQVVTPSKRGEIIYEVIRASIPPMLDPKLTASWEKGLTMVADGEISAGEYMDRLNDYVRRRTELVKGLQNADQLRQVYRWVSQFYKDNKSKSRKEK